MSSKKSNKKKKQEVKDIIDVNSSVKTEKSYFKKDIDDKKDLSFNQKIKMLLTEKRIPILSYCYKLFSIDLENLKNNPNKIATNFIFENTTNKKKFIIKFLYLIFAILISISFWVIGILSFSNVIVLSDPNSGNVFFPSTFLALGTIIFFLFI